ncbi:hypothetical protein INT47_001708 [Mucor saturninus]|uniref:Uncharacterized protein n=1 Tax=Mucor saturninus TaxID=64648 RepID=A0A8H7VDC8_9FUNG|nr:hypothetical protein INT47_001708 [Mucor saturninus]
MTTAEMNLDPHQDWYRTNVYGDLFDFGFSVKSGYETKQSECHSQIIKSLRTMGVLPPQQKNVRLDFIFTHVAGLNVSFFCEDKPRFKTSARDNMKSKDLREKTLVYWSYLLPYEDCLTFITAVSCQFYKLNLQFKETKIIDGVIVHTILKEVNISSDEQDS